MDPYNAVIISEYEGKLQFNNLVEGVTYREEVDEQLDLQKLLLKKTEIKR